MPDDNDRIEEMRGELRAKRTNSQPSSGQDGTSFQTVFGEGRSTQPTHRRVNLVAGGPDKKPVGQRRTTRRSSDGDSGVHDGTSTNATGTRGRRQRIKAEDSITRTYEEGLAPTPVTIPKRPVGRPPKIIATVADVEKKITGVVANTFSGSGKKVLTKQEATALEDPLRAVIPDMTGYLDELLWWQIKDTTHAPIWSDLDSDEIEIITRLLLKQGQKNPVVAEGVRTMVDAADWIAAGMIVIPRTITSMKKLTAIAAEERKKKLEARYATTTQQPFVPNRTGN